ncbi:MAG: hypothetical protein Q8R44_14090 [Novosphingobium sp.]|nr:hypothetical protein [Novosphingobium sp.]
MDFDLSRPPVPLTGARIVAHIQGVIGLWRTDGLPDGDIASGSLAHFNCGNDAIIHRAAAVRRPPTRITFLGGGFQTWSTDSNIHHTDWMLRGPCPQP